MRILVSIVLLFTLNPSLFLDNEDDILVLFWNLENFFDWKNEGKGKSDSDFSSEGERHWTASKFYRKSDAAAKAVLWIADKYEKMPDVIGLCEVENKGVLHKWLTNSALRKFNYRIIHYESGDKRGIDVALLYRSSTFKYICSSIKVPEYNGKKLLTRDILEVSLEHLSDGMVYHFLVNHHPSKFGGGKASDLRRYAAMNTLHTMCDSLFSLSGERHIIAMGDFNDNPSGEQFSIIEGVLCNKSMFLYEEGRGTIRFQGKWDLIDMFLVDNPLIDNTMMDIINIPFLMVWDNTYPGFKPYRTFSGPRYIGGVSDHCPIVLKINVQE